MPELDARLGSRDDGNQHLTTVPERRQARLLEGILGVLGRLGERRPVLLVIEDLHRADAGTRTLVDVPRPDRPRPARGDRRYLPGRRDPPRRPVGGRPAVPRGRPAPAGPPDSRAARTGRPGPPHRVHRGGAAVGQRPGRGRRAVGWPPARGRGAPGRPARAADGLAHVHVRGPGPRPDGRPLDRDPARASPAGARRPAAVADHGRRRRRGVRGRCHQRAAAVVERATPRATGSSMPISPPGSTRPSRMGSRSRTRTGSSCATSWSGGPSRRDLLPSARIRHHAALARRRRGPAVHGDAPLPDRARCAGRRPGRHRGGGSGRSRGLPGRRAGRPRAGDLRAGDGRDDPATSSVPWCRGPGRDRRRPAPDRPRDPRRRSRVRRGPAGPGGGLPRCDDRGGRCPPGPDPPRPDLRPARPVPAGVRRCRGSGRRSASRSGARPDDAVDRARRGRGRAGPAPDAGGHVLRRREARSRRHPHRPGLRSAGRDLGAARHDDPRGVARLARGPGCRGGDADRRPAHGRGPRGPRRALPGLRQPDDRAGPCGPARGGRRRRLRGHRCGSLRRAGGGLRQLPARQRRGFTVPARALGGGPVAEHDRARVAAGRGQLPQHARLARDRRDRAVRRRVGRPAAGSDAARARGRTRCPAGRSAAPGGRLLRPLARRPGRRPARRRPRLDARARDRGLDPRRSNGGDGDRGRGRVGGRGPREARSCLPGGCPRTRPRCRQVGRGRRPAPRRRPVARVTPPRRCVAGDRACLPPPGRRSRRSRRPGARSAMPGPRSKIPYEIARARWREAEARLASGAGRAGRADARKPLLDAVDIALSLGAIPLVRELRELAGRALITLPPQVDDLVGTSPEDGSRDRAPVAVGPGAAAAAARTAPSRPRSCWVWPGARRHPRSATRSASAAASARC